MEKKLLAVAVVGVLSILILSFPISTVFAGGSERVENPYFSINVPNSWTYVEASNTPEADKTGYGPGNNIGLTPNEFSDLLLIDSYDEKFGEKVQDGGAFATFFQDIDYRIKNAPLESYVKYVIDKATILNITSQK